MNMASERGGLGELAQIWWENANLSGDSAGSARMIARQHVDNDTCLLAVIDEVSLFGSRRIVEAYQTGEGEIRLDSIAVDVNAFVVFSFKRIAG